MRLINVDTMQLETYLGSQTPQYVCLSHRWSDEELAFEDYENPVKRNTVGRTKIEAFCSFVRQDEVCKMHDVRHIWCDMVCIDKRSSAELSEAINAMASIYARCFTCVAYLVDVDSAKPGVEEAFNTSEWFRRCWTLQELLFPEHVCFVDCSWVRLGTTSQTTVATRVEFASGIPKEVLLHQRDYETFTVAQRMSWASLRSATRIEDEAYSLLGLFNVNMPLLYGEGSKAFGRLQMEIIRQSDDESIFAWCGEVEDPGPTTTSILARDAGQFFRCADVERTDTIHRSPYSITNRGLEIRTSALHLFNPPGMAFADVYLIEFNCTRPFAGNIPNSSSGNTFKRRTCSLAFVEMRPGVYSRIPLTVRKDAELYELVATGDWKSELEPVTVVEDRTFYLDMELEPTLVQWWHQHYDDDGPFTLMRAFEMRKDSREEREGGV